VAIAVVIVLIPIAIRVPATIVLIPPSMIFLPAALARFVKLVAPTLSLLTAIAMVLDCFVQLVIGFRNTPLAAVTGAHVRSACKQEQAGECCCSKCRSSEERIL
jgi:hypothetical protein